MPENDKLVSDYGRELFRYLDDRGRLRSVRENGVTLAQTWDNREWRVLFRMKPGSDPGAWVRAKEQQYLERPPWARDIKELPSLEELKEWLHDGGCDSVNGHFVEPDGMDHTGAPSWLRALCLI